MLQHNDVSEEGVCIQALLAIPSSRHICPFCTCRPCQALVSFRCLSGNPLQHMSCINRLPSAFIEQQRPNCNLELHTEGLQSRSGRLENGSNTSMRDPRACTSIYPCPAQQQMRGKEWCVVRRWPLCWAGQQFQVAGNIPLKMPNLPI